MTTLADHAASRDAARGRSREQRLRARRNALGAWPPACAQGRTALANGRLDDEAQLRFAPPLGAYGRSPGWRSRRHFLAALPFHPRLEVVCRANQVAPDALLAWAALVATRGDVETGRNIAVSNDVLARLLGYTPRHVRNITRTARQLGVYQVVLAGTTMTLAQRGQVLDAYGRGHPPRRWRNLPNIAAATVPPVARAPHAKLIPGRRRITDNSPGHRWRAA